MKTNCVAWICVGWIAVVTHSIAAAQPTSGTLNVVVPDVKSDAAVTWDYDIVYVRAPRFGDERATRWAEVFHPMNVDPGSDLVLLHPDGSEDVLVEGGDGAVADPFVSFDGQWIYYVRFHDQTKQAPWGFPRGGSDIYKIHVGTRKIVRLTHQERTPNTGILTADEAKHMPVFNLGPCPAPRGRVVFTSNRNLFEAPKMYTRGSFQLFAMDDDGANTEMIGHLNIASALHPVILRDGRVMFSSYESQGLRDLRNWGLWFIQPDGTGWGPIVSSFQGSDVYHFHTQLSDGSIVFEAYYNLNNFGFGTLYRMPAGPRKDYSAFGPADRNDERNPKQANPRKPRFAFTPDGLQSVTRFVSSFDSPAGLSNRDDPESRRVGKFTHPCGAPDNHLLAVWSPGSVNSNGSHRKFWFPRIDSGIYLIKHGDPIDEPSQMRLIKNDPKYNEQWPRPVVPYKRIYGVDAPRYKAPPTNDGTASPHLKAGSPFGLVGTSSFYKRESVTAGAVAKDSVTAANPRQDRLKGLRPFNKYRPGIDHWFNQGSDCGVYDNSDIHAIRIIAQEPASQRKRMFWNWGDERYRILGEIPLRKFERRLAAKSGASDSSNDSQPLDPDGNPDTSFLARIPADTSFTFQTLDKYGMSLNMAQTWHQVRPGEIRHDCGGCHAHSQQPTDFSLTAAARPNYQVLDLAHKTPLLTDKAGDESGRRWDVKDETGLRFEAQGAVNVEFFRHIVPIFKKSCGGCHSKDNPKPAANLVFDDMEMVKGGGGGGMFRSEPGGKIPATYAMLVRGRVDRYGHKHVNGGWVLPQVSRYVRAYQSRRSLLAWKVLGQRNDGWSNDDFPSATTPGDSTTLQLGGKPVEADPQSLAMADVDFTGSIMPPPAAVRAGKVQPLTDDDRRTIFRWIDLGCPIDLEFDGLNPTTNGPASGWMDDETRPTLTMNLPKPGRSERLDRIVIGMHDYFTGLNFESFSVTADFEIDGTPSGENLASRFKTTSPNVWELKLTKPIETLTNGTLTVSVKDRQGNITRIERT
ncbi:MAG: hypothetical protein O3A00_17720, partial [Planctomycetota bacterium]|nr:hypothetical protein [Planctomycetota bacterium]